VARYQLRAPLLAQSTCMACSSLSSHKMRLTPGRRDLPLSPCHTLINNMAICIAFLIGGDPSLWAPLDSAWGKQSVKMLFSFTMSSNFLISSCCLYFFMLQAYSKTHIFSYLTSCQSLSNLPCVYSLQVQLSGCQSLQQASDNTAWSSTGHLWAAGHKDPSEKQDLREAKSNDMLSTLLL
jgi:hypothetical protein